MTYREGHHSTSDDSTRYREAAEIQDWRSRANPIVRMSKYLTAKGLWDADKDAELLKRLRKDGTCLQRRHGMALQVSQCIHPPRPPTFRSAEGSGQRGEQAKARCGALVH